MKRFADGVARRVALEERAVLAVTGVPPLDEATGRVVQKRRLGDAALPLGALGELAAVVGGEM